MQIIGDNETLTGTLYSSNNSIDDLSLSINSDYNLLLIGVPHLDQIFIYEYSSDPNQSYLYYSTLAYHQIGVGFGKSVAWLSNETIAILSYSLSTHSCATSQIQVKHLSIFHF